MVSWCTFFSCHASISKNVLGLFLYQSIYIYLFSFQPLQAMCWKAVRLFTTILLFRVRLPHTPLSACMLSRFSPVPLFATPWTVTYQAYPSMEFSRQGYWSGLPCPPPGIFPTQRVNPFLLSLRQILYYWATKEAHSHSYCVFFAHKWPIL